MILLRRFALFPVRHSGDAPVSLVLSATSEKSPFRGSEKEASMAPSSRGEQLQPHMIGSPAWHQSTSSHSSTCAWCDGEDNHISAGELNSSVANSKN